MRIKPVLLVILLTSIKWLYAQTPTLGTYPATALIACGNTSVLPTGASASASSITAFTTTDFKGALQVDSSTGKLTVTNAHPAGTYLIIVKAFNGPAAITTSFTLTVSNYNCNGNFNNNAIPLAAGSYPYAITVGDFNGDGNQDYATANVGNQTISIGISTGTGSFVSAPDIVLLGAVFDVIRSDFNGDGNQDFATAIAGNGTASIRLGSISNIVVQGNNIVIQDGSNTPDSSNYTYLGSTPITATLSRTFVLQNTGTDTLRITRAAITGQDSTYFKLFDLSLPLMLLPESSQTFLLDFSSADGGLKNTRFHILSDDCNRADFDFAISGKAICTRLSANNVWLGITANWNTASNWSLGFVPNGCGKAVVNIGVPFMPQIRTNAICYSLTLNNGATFTVTGTGNLTITGP